MTQPYMPPDDSRAARIAELKSERAAWGVYTFPGRSGWTFDSDLNCTHESGARVWSEQIDGDDEWHHVVHWLATTASGEQLGPFAKFAQAIGAAVPRGQLWLKGVAA